MHHFALIGHGDDACPVLNSPPESFSVQFVSADGWTGHEAHSIASQVQKSSPSVGPSHQVVGWRRTRRKVGSAALISPAVPAPYVSEDRSGYQR